MKYPQRCTLLLQRYQSHSRTPPREYQWPENPQISCSNFSSYPSKAGGLFLDLTDTKRNSSTSIFKTSSHEQHGSIATITDLDLDSLKYKTYLTTDSINGIQSGLLKAAVGSLLPRDRYAGNVEKDWFHPGYQQVYFRPQLTPAHLLKDGTDNRFLPGSELIWAYRLWGGGSVTLFDERPKVETLQSKAVQVEQVDDIRIVGASEPERVFITVEKDIWFTERDEDLHATEVQTKYLNTRDKTPPALRETYILCFLRNPPGTTAGRSAIRPPGGEMLRHTIKPTSNMLFQFSALTHNAHAIHVNPTFAQTEYKLKAPVVHGPLTMLLMLEFVRLSLAGFNKVRDGLHLICKHFDYKNLSPLFVDEEFTLCCKPLKLEGTKEPWQAKQWQVWIQTGSGDATSLAAKGTVTVEAVPVERM